MHKIKKNENRLILEKGNIEYLELVNDSGVQLKLRDPADFQVTKEEFKNFVKNSKFKDQLITCRISDDEIKKNIVLNLGFYFEGIEFNPETEETEEIYNYRYKEEFFIKDSELKEILEKLEIK